MVTSKKKKLHEQAISEIKDSRFSVKGYFHELFKQLLPTELLQNERLTTVNELITESRLPEVLAKKYEKDGYIILFYAHKPHSHMISPFNHDKNASHTSLLLCRITEGRINQTLNIDGYHNLGYIDILGEREKAKPNPYIQNRLVIDAPDEGNPRQRYPLQGASWYNINCPLYALAFTEAILRAFNFRPEILDNLFIGNDSFCSEAALNNLKDMIIQGVEGRYVKKVNHGETIAFYRDSEAGKRFHERVRDTLAETVARRQNVSVVPLSLFNETQDRGVKNLIDKARILCTTYQTHLHEEIEKFASDNALEVESLLITYVIKKDNPANLDFLIQKYKIVTSMIAVLDNKKEPNPLDQIKNLKEILTPENKRILEEHRSKSGKFLQRLLNLISAAVGVEFKYRSKGDKLCANIEILQDSKTSNAPS